MVSPLQPSIRTSANEDHYWQADKIRNHHEQTHPGIRVLAGKIFHELRHPENHRVKAEQLPEVNRSQVPNPSVRQCPTSRNSASCQLSLFFTRQFSRDPI